MKRIVPILFFILFSISLVSALCTDSDGGKNKYEFGSVIENDETFEDECNGESINEYFCSIEDSASYTTLPCVNGCENGECLLANQVPKSPAPEEIESSPYKIYFYGFIIIILVGLYVYWFRFHKKRKGY